MTPLPSWLDALLGRLGWTSLQAMLLVGAIWLICKYLPRLSAATRSLLWWLVGAQLLLGLLLPTPVMLPLLARAAPASLPVVHVAAMPTFAPPSEYRVGNFAATAGSPAAAVDEVTTLTPPHAMTEAGSALPWRSALLAFWLAGVLLQSWVALRQWRGARAVLRASRVLCDAHLQEACRTQAHAMGLRRCPSLRVSGAIHSPQVSGWWRPVVLLPANHAMTVEESRLALSHELAHLRRGDLWLCWVPAVAQRLFFFHPLVAWAMREYALNREAACDAQVLQRHDAAPQDYGRLLLRLGVAHPLHAGLAGASSTFLNLKRRLAMLQHGAQGATPRWRSAMLVLLVAVAGVLPYRVTEAAGEAQAPVSGLASAATAATPAQAAAAATPAGNATSTRDASPAAKAAPVAHVVPANQAIPMPRPASDAAGSRQPTYDWMPPPPPMPPTPPSPLPPPAPQTPPAPLTPPTPPAPPMPLLGMRGHHVDVDIANDARNGFALLDDKASTILVNGTDRDVEAAKRQRNGTEPLLWFRRGTQAYVVRDTRTIDQARAAYAPMHDIASMQSRIASQQSRIASIQGRMASRQGERAARQVELMARQSELQAQRTQLESQRAALASRPGVTAADLHEMDAQIRMMDSEMRSVASREQNAPDDREVQRDLEDLNRQQDELSRQQRALEERQSDLVGKADSQMRRLLDEAIASGVAKPVAVR